MRKNVSTAIMPHGAHLDAEACAGEVAIVAIAAQTAGVSGVNRSPGIGSTGERERMGKWVLCRGIALGLLPLRLL